VAAVANASRPGLRIIGNNTLSRPPGFR
jgi:hypothetical protein